MSGTAKSLALIVVGGLIVRLGFLAISNRLEGKDIFGEKIARKVPKKTHMDWKGNIVLSKDDFRIEAA